MGLDGILGMGVTFILKDEFTRTSQKIKSEFQSLTGVTDNLSQKVASSMNAMKLGFGAVALGGALLTPFVLATNKAMEFEAQMSKVKAVMSPSDIKKFSGSLTELAMEMGAKTSFSAVQASQGIEELVKAGVSLTSIMNGGLQGALDLAVAGELDLASAAEIASTALNAFRKDNLTVTQAGNILAGAANASATSVSELKFGLQMVSAVASGAGMSFNDTSTALAVFANNGLKGSDAGTSLKTMLMNLTPNTKDAMEAMQKFGIITANGANQFYDSAGSLKSIADISGILKTQLDKLNPQQRGEALRKMFGADAIRAANILFNEGTAGVKKMNEEMLKVTASQVAAEKLNNLKGQLTIMASTFETIAIVTGNLFIPSLTYLAKTFNFLLTVFVSFSRSPIGGYIILLIGTAGTLLTVIGSLVLVMQLARFASLQASLAFASMGNAQIASAFATNGLLGGLKALTIQAYQSLLAFAPYIITFAVIAGAVYFAYRSFQAFQDVLSGTAKPANGLLGLMQRFGGVISAVIQIFKSWNGKTFDLAGMEAGLKSLGILDFVLNLSTWIVRLIEFVKGIGTAFYNSFSFVASIVGAVYKYIVDSINSFANALGFQGQWLGKSTSSIQAWIYAGQVLGYVIVGVLVVAFGYLAISVISALWPFIAIAGAVAGLIYLIYNWKAVVQTVTSWVSSAFNYLANNLVTDISKALFWIAQNVPAYIGMAFRFALDLVVMYFTQFIPFLVTQIWYFLGFLITNLPTVIGNVFYYALQFVYVLFTQFIPSFIGIVANFLLWIAVNVPYLIASAFMSAFIFVYNLLGEFFFSAGKFFYDFGANLVESIKNGILSMWDSFTGWLSDMIKGIPGIEYLIGETEPSGTSTSQRQQVGQSLNKNDDLSNAISRNKATFNQSSNPIVFDKTVTRSEQPIFNIMLDSEEIGNKVVRKQELDSARK